MCVNNLRKYSTIVALATHHQSAGGKRCLRNGAAASHFQTMLAALLVVYLCSAPNQYSVFGATINRSWSSPIGGGEDYLITGDNMDPELALAGEDMFAPQKPQQTARSAPQRYSLHPKNMNKTRLVWNCQLACGIAPELCGACYMYGSQLNSIRGGSNDAAARILPSLTSMSNSNGSKRSSHPKSILRTARIPSSAAAYSAAHDALLTALVTSSDDAHRATLLSLLLAPRFGSRLPFEIIRLLYATPSAIKSLRE